MQKSWVLPLCHGDPCYLETFDSVQVQQVLKWVRLSVLTLHHLSGFQVGGVLGVCLRSGGKVDFYMNKQCVTTAETKYVGDIWGCVDLYGQASQAAIYTGQAPPEPKERLLLGEDEMVKLIGSLAGLMKAKEDDLKKVKFTFISLGRKGMSSWFWLSRNVC